MPTEDNTPLHMEYNRIILSYYPIYFFLKKKKYTFTPYNAGTIGVMSTFSLNTERNPATLRQLAGTAFSYDTTVD